MGEAGLGFLGVILGAAIAGGISLWQVQLVTKREREARGGCTATRSGWTGATPSSGRRCWPSRMRHATVREHERRTALMKDRGSWLPRDGVLLPDGWTEGAERRLWLQARVLDQELRCV